MLQGMHVQQSLEITTLGIRKQLKDFKPKELKKKKKKRIRFEFQKNNSKG